MNRQQSNDWDMFRAARAVDPVAAEKGRLYAATLIRTDPAVRKKMEEAYGVDFCKVNYPEAYTLGHTVSVLMDKARAKFKWWE